MIKILTRGAAVLRNVPAHVASGQWNKDNLHFLFEFNT